jgi:hypothetical protein
VAVHIRQALAELRDRIWRRLPAPGRFDPEAMLKPPWIVQPDWPADSIGWRMGGEDYFFAVRHMYRALTPPEQAAYDRAYPAPPGWERYLHAARRG